MNQTNEVPALDLEAIVERRDSFTPFGSYEKSMAEDIDALIAEVRRADAERETLIYWLIRAYHSGHREGWEEGPSTDETMDGLLSVLANRHYDPNEDEAAKQLLKQKPRY